MGGMDFPVEVGVLKGLSHSSNYCNGSTVYVQTEDCLESIIWYCWLIRMSMHGRVG